MESLEQRIGVGSRVYHMTSADNWNSIQRYGLIPKSKSNSLRINNTHANLKFIVCGIKRNFEDWKEYEVFNDLFAHIRSNSVASDFMRKYIKFYESTLLLSFLIEKEDSVFVSDGAHVSPKRCKDKYGVDLYEQGPNNFSCPFYELLWRKQRELYADSFVLLKDYKGFYKIPEIWYPHKVSADDIVVEEVLK